ncbi:unnamed protein product [Adineta ricciae]|uniref:Uncharacterized protein n=1 Tax=Adineta ricciae TaxID=249248 RepID=A0A815VEW4_ADIRI|nr:unnamed protein product [Adineta ricciae]CAF1531135.1 unnamed protein product [Adineta ricciae]
MKSLSNNSIRHSGSNDNGFSNFNTIESIYNCALLYSTSRYKRKHYVSSGQLNESNVKSIHYLEVKKNEPIENFTGFFPNVTQLTLCNTFYTPPGVNASRLNRILPLKQITKLRLHSDRFSSKQMLDLLSSAVNIRTLELNAFGFSKIDVLLAEQVFKTNAIKHVRISRVHSLDEFKLYVHLFPRLESLIIGLDKGDFRSIVKFVLLQSNHYL